MITTKKSLVEIVVVLMKFLEMQEKYYFLGKARNLQDNSSVQQFYFFTSAFFFFFTLVLGLGGPRQMQKVEFIRPKNRHFYNKESVKCVVKGTSLLAKLWMCLLKKSLAFA